MISDTDRAKMLLQLLNQSQFPGSQRMIVLDLANWLEAIRDERLKVVQQE